MIRVCCHCGAWVCLLVLALAGAHCSNGDEQKQAPVEREQAKAEPARADEDPTRKPGPQARAPADEADEPRPQTIEMQSGNWVDLGKRKKGRASLEALSKRLRSRAAGHEFSPIPKTGEEEMRRERMRRKGQ